MGIFETIQGIDDQLVAWLAATNATTDEEKAKRAEVADQHEQLLLALDTLDAAELTRAAASLAKESDALAALSEKMRAEEATMETVEQVLTIAGQTLQIAGQVIAFLAA